MDFKNKLGTVDAHNLNLNFKPENTDSHNIILNFEHLADGSTNLNFGDDVSAVIDTVLDAEFSFEVTAIYADSGVNTAVIDTVLDTEFSFEVVAVFKDNIDARIKELDNNLSDKLVNDLTHLTNSYSKTLKDEQSKVLDRFEQASKEISKKQSDILKAITEPLKINLNHND